MEKKTLRYWKALPALATGAVAGLGVLIELRVQYFQLAEYAPGMAPQIAFQFSLVLFAAVLAFALPLEALFRRFWHAPATHGQAALAGLAYPLLLTWWVLPDHGALFLVFNPLVGRAAVGLAFRPGRPGGG